MFDGKKDGFFAVCNLGSQWNLEQTNAYPGGLFASVGQMGIGFGVSPDSPNSRDNGGIKAPFSDLFLKYLPSQEEIRVVGVAEGEAASRTKKKAGLKLKIKVSNPSMRRLISGAIAGAVSRTCVAPLETIRTHLMVGSSGSSTLEVFNNIMQTDGWKGLFRGNFANVIRVAPSKAIEVLNPPFLNYYFMDVLLFVCGFVELDIAMLVNQSFVVFLLQ